MDRFNFFCLPVDVQAFFKQYLSPECENSWFKGLPIDRLEHARQQLRILGGFRIRFRGPRLDAMRAYCRKSDARTFAIYPNNRG